MVLSSVWNLLLEVEIPTILRSTFRFLVEAVLWVLCLNHFGVGRGTENTRSFRRRSQAHVFVSSFATLWTRKVHLLEKWTRIFHIFRTPRACSRLTESFRPPTILVLPPAGAVVQQSQKTCEHFVDKSGSLFFVSHHFELFSCVGPGRAD